MFALNDRAHWKLSNTAPAVGSRPEDGMGWNGDPASTHSEIKQHCEVPAQQNTTDFMF